MNSSLYNGLWPTTKLGYQAVAPLGQGTFGVVWKYEVVEGPKKGTQVAIKIVHLDECSDLKLDELTKTMVLINSFSHPNLLPTHVSFIEEEEIWLVAEFMGCGSMANVLAKNFPNGIKDSLVLSSILKEILRALEYLHSKKAIHREIKASNVLVSSTGCIKLCDFGLMTQVKEKKKNHSIVGSVCWMAPEMLDDTGEGYDEKVDIWSFGITAYELAYGKPPYSDITTMKAIVRTVQQGPPSIDRTDGWDSPFIDLVEACLKKNPKSRPLTKDLMKMKFITKSKPIETLKEKFFLRLSPIEATLTQAFKNNAILELNEKKEKKKAPTFVWNFDVEEDEGKFKEFGHLGEEEN